MGFYHPSTIVKDAQRHGLKVLPIDVMKSEWKCTVEHSALSRRPSAGPVVGRPSSVVGKESREARMLRLGLRYARGLREEAGQALVRQRGVAPFTSIRDIVHRVPELRKDELNTLAEIGALNSVGSAVDSRLSSVVGANNESSHLLDRRPTTNDKRPDLHRRDALWQVERAVRRAGPLLDSLSEPDGKSPLHPMDTEERLVADFRGTGMTTGPHPMAYHRARMNSLGVRKASDLGNIRNGQRIRIGGCVIARQRPGTAKGFVFLSLEDETGVANAIVQPELFQKNRLLLGSEQFLLIDGILQNQDNVISVKAERVSPLEITRAQTSSHDFH
jgi:error-prone DNA polymerase